MFEFLKKIINKASPEKKPAAKKEVVKNQEGIEYWLERVKEVEAKISLVK